jgi:hypothetical protein
VKQLKFFAILTLLALLASRVALSQQNRSRDPKKPAANAWMLTPIPYLAWNQDIPAPLREQRDSFWDELSHRTVALTSPAREATSTPTGQSRLGPDSEIIDLPNRAILSAAFTKYRSVLSASELSLYTELTMHIEEVFADETGSGHPFADRDITILVPGGTVTLPSGTILSDGTEPRELFLQPGNKYLLVLSYHREDEFYTYADDWDISDGIARANTYRTQGAAKSGHSSINGVPVSQLGPAINKQLYGRK